MHIGGIHAILIHTISEPAKRFYEGHGFIASPLDPLMLMITWAETLKMLGADENQLRAKGSLA